MEQVRNENSGKSAERPECDLWRSLAGMRIEPEGAALSFEARLARWNGWSRAYAREVMEEYRRFLFLAATAAHPVTPSEDVDEAWHLHLAYSRHYWEVLCGEILGRPLHHGPTAGGSAEQRRYRHQYEDTLSSYSEVFGMEPPAEIWPPAAVRFARGRMRVDASRYWLVPKGRVRIGVAVLAAGLLAGACKDVAGEGASAWLALLGAVAAGVIVSILAMSWNKTAEWVPPHYRDRRLRRGDGGGDGAVYLGDGGSGGHCHGAEGGHCGGGDAGGGCGSGCGGCGS